MGHGLIDPDHNRYMTAPSPVLSVADPDQLAQLCRRHRIRQLALFGSRSKGTARPDSDVDLLVEFEPGARVTLLDMAQIELDLSPLFGGAKVDLRTARELSRYFRDEVLHSAQPQYVAG